MSARGKYKGVTLQNKMEVLIKLDHGASIQSLMNQCCVSRSTLYGIKKL
jgi:hypothetical protein